MKRKKGEMPGSKDIYSTPRYRNKYSNIVRKMERNQLNCNANKSYVTTQTH